MICVIQEEGIRGIEPLAPGSFEEQLKQTLLCFVLVDPSGKHHFCSRYDFGPWPLLPGVDALPEGVLKVLLPTGGAKALGTRTVCYIMVPQACAQDDVALHEAAGS